MPVYRQGDVPHPPTGVPEHSDEVYTQKGFFGDWVHIYRRHNAGVPKRVVDATTSCSPASTRTPSSRPI